MRAQPSGSEAQVAKVGVLDIRDFCVNIELEISPRIVIIEPPVIDCDIFSPAAKNKHLFETLSAMQSVPLESTVLLGPFPNELLCLLRWAQAPVFVLCYLFYACLKSLIIVKGDVEGYLTQFDLVACYGFVSCL